MVLKWYFLGVNSDLGLILCSFHTKLASVKLEKTPPKAMEWGWAPPLSPHTENVRRNVTFYLRMSALEYLKHKFGHKVHNNKKLWLSFWRRKKNILINFFHQSSIHWSKFTRNDNFLKRFQNIAQNYEYPLN